MHKDLNRHLARQLSKLGLDARHPPDASRWSNFLSIIDKTYHDADQGRYSLERLLAISSEEMHSLHQRQKSSLEARLAALFQISSDALMILAPPSWKFTDANQSALQLFGASSLAEFTALRLSDVSPEKQPDGLLSADKAQTMIEIAMRQGSHFFEWVHRRHDGQPFVAEVLLTRVEVEKEFFLQASVRDITERKRHESQIIENEQRLLDILNVSPIAVRIAVKQGREVVFYNPRYADLIKNTHAKGDDPKKYYVRIEDYEEVVAELARGNTVVNRQIELSIPDGSTVWTLASYMPMQYHGEDAVLGWFYDITERKKTEIELRIAATAFESKEGLLITDANNIILRVNQAFTAISGYSAEEVIGKTPRVFGSGRHDANFYAAMWNSINSEGTWEGEIWNRRKNGEIFPERLAITAVKDQKGVVTNYVASLVDITLRKSAEEEIKHLALYDHLTDLPNRRLLLDRLRQALASSARSGREGALLFIDLDNFKSLNDTLGHDIGDILLQQVAQRIESCVREGDTVARLGGDEFVVMLEQLSNHRLEAAAQTELVCEKILDTLSKSYQLAGNEFRCTSSIGATLFIDPKQPIENLLKQADIAMYQSKKAGRNTVRFFDPQMQENINARSAMENELHKALEKHQIHLYYQIQVDSHLRPLGAEALIRWIHPERGLVSPAQFIPLAEETGLILPIGQWVLETACAQIKAWQQDEHSRALVLAVNVSAKQFRQADFVSQVRVALQQHAINPGLLKLELTESSLLDNIEDTIATMNKLHEVGVQFSLDDFGTGYSSLQYLKRLPLDQLKIDQSFVRDIAADSSDKAIVQTIIAMAHGLHLDVIAEGVETAEQQQSLLDMGCTHFQGYLFSKPVPIEQFEELLAR